MTNEQKVGLFFCGGLVLALAALELTVGTGILEKSYHLWVEYDDVHGLATGDPVFVAGVKLGVVDDVTLTPEHVRVRLRLERRAQVRRDSRARLDYQLLGGTRFVSISLGSAEQPLLGDGETLRGEQSPGVTDMLDRFAGVADSVQELTESLNRNQDELLSTVSAVLGENREQLRATLENLESLTAKLDRGGGVVAKLLNDPTLYDQATAIMTDVHAISARLARGEGSLGRLVHEERLYDEIEETMTSLNAAARNLEDIAADIRDGRGTLGRLLTDESLYVEAQDAVRGLERAAAGIEDQSPMAVLATLVSTLF